MNKEVIVKFGSNGGNNISQVVVKYGFLIQVPEPVKLGYNFVCWCKDENLKNEFDPNKIIECDITLYAKWTKYAPKKFINDISSYSNFSNVVKDYHRNQNNNRISEEEQAKNKREKARLDKSNYVKKLNDEYDGLLKEKETTQSILEKKKKETEKIKSKMNKKIKRSGEAKAKKIIFEYNEIFKKEEEAKIKYDDVISKIDILESKYEEFASKNR